MTMPLRLAVAVLCISLLTACTIPLTGRQHQVSARDYYHDYDRAGSAEATYSFYASPGEGPAPEYTYGYPFFFPDFLIPFGVGFYNFGTDYGSSDPGRSIGVSPLRR